MALLKLKMIRNAKIKKFDFKDRKNNNMSEKMFIFGKTKIE